MVTDVSDQLDVSIFRVWILKKEAPPKRPLLSVISRKTWLFCFDFHYFTCGVKISFLLLWTGWRTKCHTIDCARNTFLLLQKHLTYGAELILIGWKIVPNEEHVQCDHRFASQPLANEPLHSSQLFDTSLQKARATTSLCGPWAVTNARVRL